MAGRQIARIVRQFIRTANGSTVPMVGASSGVDHRSFRHWGGFILSGGTAFLVDAGLTTALIRFLHLDPFSARFLGITAAMVVAWLMHRRITFNVAAAPSWNEFGRFAAVAWSANALNYTVYALILLLHPTTLPFAALVIATAIATVFSYIGFRLGVFRQPSP
jgi:putative flippase GtrA